MRKQERLETLCPDDRARTVQNLINLAHEIDVRLSWNMNLKELIGWLNISHDDGAPTVPMFVPTSKRERLFKPSPSSRQYNLFVLLGETVPEVKTSYRYWYRVNSQGVIFLEWYFEGGKLLKRVLYKSEIH